MHKWKNGVVGIFISFLWLAIPAGATDYTWTGAATPIGGLWTNASNWSPSTGYPSQTGDRAIFPNGSNGADMVGIQNGNNQKTNWSSSNQIQQLTVSANTTLEIAAGAILTVEGPIVNLGAMAEIPPGRIHHDADSLEVLSENMIPIRELRAGSAFRILLRDADEGLRVSEADTAAGIQVLNPRNGDLLNLVAIETMAPSMIFLTAEIPTQSLSSAVSDNMLQVVPGDNIRISYTDNEDPNDNTRSVTLPVVSSSVSTTLFPGTTLPSSTILVTTTTSTLPVSTTQSTGTTSIRPTTTSTTLLTTTSTSPVTTSTTTSSSTTTTQPAQGGPATLLEFAQLAAGSGYQSYLILMNPGNEPSIVTATFRNPEGLPLGLLVNGQVNSSLAQIIPARGTVKLRILSPDGQLQSGWCRVVSNIPIGGVLIYQLLDGNNLLSEASVLPSPRLRRLSIAVAQLNLKSDVGIALANVSEQEAVLTGRFLSTGGSLLSETTSRLQPGQQKAQFVTQLFPAVDPASEGSIEITSTREIIVVGLLFQANVFTTLPVLMLP